MKKILFIVLNFVLALTYSFGQNGFKRQFKLPNSYNNTTQAFFETTNNNYIVSGLVVDTFNTFLTNRLALIGLNAQGQTQWIKKYGSKKFEYLDNSLITKWFYKQGSFLYHAGCVRDSNNKYLGVALKFDFNGDTVWQKRFYETGYDLIPQNIIGSVDGGFLICGMIQNTSSRLMLLIKIDSNGNELWRKKISKSTPNIQDAKSVQQDTVSKKIVTVGYQAIGTSSAYANYPNIMIFDSLGTLLDQLTYPLGNEGTLVDLIQTKDKKFVAVGSVKNPLMVGSLETARSYILKFDIDQVTPIMWQKQFEAPSPINLHNSIKELINGDFIVCGIFDSLLLNNQSANYLQKLLRINKNGVTIWKRYYNYQTNAPAGNYQSMLSLNLAFDGAMLGAISIGNPGVNPFFVVKYDSLGCDSSSFYCQTVNIDELNILKQSLKVYPNPTNGLLKISNYDLSLYKNLSIKINDVFGTAVFESNLSNEINISDFKQGVYFIQFFEEKRLLFTEKIVKE